MDTKSATFAFSKKEFRIIEKDHTFAVVKIIGAKNHTKKEIEQVIKEVEEIHDEIAIERAKHKLKKAGNISG